MENISRVTEHIQSRLAQTPGTDTKRCTLTIIPTVDNQLYYQDDEGNSWRTYIFIPGAQTRDVIDQPRQAYEAARAFAGFQSLLSDLPQPPLHEVIPFFHHTPSRYQALVEAIADDARNRASTCKAEIDFALARMDEAGLAIEGLASGALPSRVTHNDTKINNVMLDDSSGEYVCVIDLDTVMPGTVLYDFGDQIRTSVGHFEENEKDLSKVYVDMALFEQLVDGYLSVARDFLVNREIELLWSAGRLITGEIGVRFLTDYLQGDTYFKTSYPDENLDRTRSQLRFVAELENNREAMEAIVEKHRKP